MEGRGCGEQWSMTAVVVCLCTPGGSVECNSLARSLFTSSRVTGLPLRDLRRITGVVGGFEVQKL